MECPWAAGLIPVDNDYRKAFTAAIASGMWVDEGFDSRGHRVVRHVKSGRTVAFPSTSSDVNGIRNFVKAIERHSGLRLWERGSRKPSRKVVRAPGFEMRQDGADRRYLSAVRRLVDEWHACDDRLQEIEAKPARRFIPEARQLISHMAELAEQIESNHHPKPTRRELVNG